MRSVVVCVALCGSLLSAGPVAALDAAPPVIDAPAAGATVSEVVSVDVTSDAPYVVAAWNGTGAIEGNEAAAGAATIELPSWGFSATETIDVAECASTPPDPDPAAVRTFQEDCLATAPPEGTASVNVTVDNAPVTIEDPSSSVIYWEGLKPLTLTVAALGGSVRFDGMPGPGPIDDDVAPYALKIPEKPGLDEGETFMVTATPCSAPWGDGLRACDDGAADHASLRIKELTPEILSVGPSPFSPNGDGVKDDLTIRYSLDERQTVAFRVLNRWGKPVTAKTGAGTRGEGTHTFAWPASGRSSLGTGNYSIELLTSLELNGQTFSGSDRRAFAIDVTPSKLTGARASTQTLYPVDDGYRDLVTLSASTNEALTASRVVIENSAGKAVRVVSLGRRSAGTLKTTWNGRSSSGSLVPEGAYFFRFEGTDAQGLTSSTNAPKLLVSSERLTPRSTTVTRFGDQYSGIFYYGPRYCVRATEERSGFARGLFLEDNCRSEIDVDFSAIEADYAFKVPAAVRYRSIKLEVYGRTTYQPVYVLGGLIRSGDDALRVFRIGSESTAWRMFKAVPSGADVFVSNKTVRARVGLIGWYGNDDFDIGSVRITVGYSVLA